MASSATCRWLAIAAVLSAAAAGAQPRITNPYAGRGNLELVVLDFKGDGVNLTNEVTTDLLAPGVPRVRWTAAGSDDGFLVCRADLLGQLGLDPMLTRGPGGGGTTLLFRGVAPATAGTTRPGRPVPAGLPHLDAWAALALLDGNHDGTLDASDPAWERLRVFVDANANGAIDAGEERTLAAAGIEAIPLAAAADGTHSFRRADGRAGAIAVVAATTAGGRLVRKPQR